MTLRNCCKKQGILKYKTAKREDKTEMNLLVLILKKAHLVNEICRDLAEEGVHGGTILDAVGMASVIEKMDDIPLFGMLRTLLADDDDDTVKMMLFVMNDEELEKARKTIKEVVGLDQPNTGIMFALPVSFVEGLGA